MKLRPYQEEVARAVVDSIRQGSGHTFSVEIARQGGKNELSAHLEVLLMTLYIEAGGSIIKCSPTFKPQTVVSMQRLRDRLGEFGFEGIYRVEMGYILNLGASRTIFLSAEETASVVGHTADILLEVDESQDVSREKYTKEFRPMGSSANVTVVHYGTTWDDTTLLEEVKLQNLELEKRDGVKRHFRYDWQEVARYNPDYLRYALSERERLGENHPLFRTQYALLPIQGGGRLFTRQQVAVMLGTHPRLSTPERSATYVAGIDLAGEHDIAKDGLPTASLPRQDATVITIAQLELPHTPSLRAPDPVLRIIEHYSWTGVPHSQLFGEVLDVLRRWRCRRVAVDATGVGQPMASFLRRQLGSRVVPIVFTQRSKSDIGFELLSFVTSGRLKLYEQDGSPQYQELLYELERARADYRPNQTMNFYVDESEGHDDFLVSLALVVEAARDYRPRGLEVVQREDV